MSDLEGGNTLRGVPRRNILMGMIIVLFIILIYTILIVNKAVSKKKKIIEKDIKDNI